MTLNFASEKQHLKFLRACKGSQQTLAKLMKILYKQLLYLILKGN